MVANSYLISPTWYHCHLNWLFNHEQLLHIVSEPGLLLPVLCSYGRTQVFKETWKRFCTQNPFVSCVFVEKVKVFHSGLSVGTNPESWNTIADCTALTDKEGGYREQMNCPRHGLQSHFARTSRFFNRSKPFVQLETTRGCFQHVRLLWWWRKTGHSL